MNDFQLFNQLLSDTPDPTESTAVSACEHPSLINSEGSTLCSSCGMEVTKKITYDKEWKYYGMNDTKHSSDPSRCYIRKSKERTIHQDIPHLDISEHIKDTANDIYNEVCKEKIHRGAFRKAIVFAAVFHAYKLDGNPQSCNHLIKIFKIKRKNGLKGLKYINEHLPRS